MNLLCLTMVTHNSLQLLSLWPSNSDQIGIRNVGFWGGRKTRQPGEKPSEQGREPTTNSTHI